MDLNKFLLAVALGLLAHGFSGYMPFPFGDDFAYAPLAEFAADPTLYAQDTQLRLFANHAQVYGWVYALGKATVGVEPVFRLMIWIMAVVTAVLLSSVLTRLKLPAFGLPIVLGLGLVVQVDGLGRADFGGLISEFFHHHTVALVLSLGAIAAAWHKKPWLAGALLGLSVYAQPMTAFHGAIAAGLGALFRAPGDAAKMALAAVVVSLPASITILPSILSGPQGILAFDLITDAYRFRQPHHYDPEWRSVFIATLYLLSGVFGAILLRRVDGAGARFWLGVLAGFGLLHLVTLVVYKLGFAQWIGFYILDATRSSSLLFVLGSVVALAGMRRAPVGALHWVTLALLGLALGLNITLGGLILIGVGLAMWRFQDVFKLRPVLAVTLAIGLIVFFPPQPFPPAVPEQTRVALAQIKEDTPRDALFLIPIAMMEFRQLAQRSAYVDFKLFSVAQPDQAVLTRERIDDLSQLPDGQTHIEGWPAAYLLGEEMSKADCGQMQALLEKTKADYFVRLVQEDQDPPECPALPGSIQSETLVVYGPVQ